MSREGDPVSSVGMLVSPVTGTFGDGLIVGSVAGGSVSSAGMLGSAVTGTIADGFIVGSEAGGSVSLPLPDGALVFLSLVGADSVPLIVG